MSLPSPSEIADGAPLEDVYLYVEDESGQARAIGHEMRTTLPEVVQEHDLSGETLRVARAEPGKMSTREIDLDHAQPSAEEAAPAGTVAAANEPGGGEQSLLQTQTESILAENERLRKRLGQIRSQYESRIDALEERYQRRIDSLRETLEDARDEADRAKEDMGAWERIAIQAGPKLPELLGAAAQRLSAPSPRQAGSQPRQIEGRAEATGSADKASGGETGGSPDTEDRQDGGEAEVTLGGEGDATDIDEKKEVLRMEIVQSALKVIDGPVTTEQFEKGLREAVEQGAIDPEAIPHSIERVVWFVRFVDENLSDYIGLLQSLGPEEAASMLCDAADFEVSEDGRRMVRKLLEHADT